MSWHPHQALLDGLFELTTPDERVALQDKIAQVKSLRVVHLTTTTGGCGVDTLLQPLLDYARALGLPHERCTFQMPEKAFFFTANLYNLLQKGGEGNLDRDEKDAYLRAQENLAHQVANLDADALIFHDLQMMAVPSFAQPKKPLAWFNHVDTTPPVSEEAEAFVRPYVEVYPLACFTTRAARFSWWPEERAHLLRLGINHRSPRNQMIERMLAGERFVELGLDPERPLLIQVSRFALWKNPWQVVDIFRLVKEEIPNAQLALVGAREAIDDVQADRIIADMSDYTRGDPDIHLFEDPAQIRDFEVNAFQRYADVVMQRSSREAFGFTITEAMWKAQPVVGTTANGCLEQIHHGETGYCVDDTDAAAMACIKLLRSPNHKADMGRAAQESVHKNHSIATMLKDYLDLVGLLTL
jgi:trehalose synthase